MCEQREASSVNKKKHKVEKNPPVNTVSLYSLATCIASSPFCCIFKTVSYEHENRKL
jgi:hypothetical protein